jgi:penicillin-binding protein 2
MKAQDESEKISVISYFVIAAFLLLIMRLWQLQILQGSEYRKLSEANRLRIVNIPAPRGIIFDRNQTPLVKNSAYYFASVIPGEFDRMKIDLLAGILKLPPEEIHARLDVSGARPFVPVRLKQGLSIEEIAYIEARKSDIPGLMIEAEVSREYPHGELGAHLIGYLGKPSPSQLKDPAFKDIPPDMFIGQWGIEKLFDDSLRGVPGKRIIEVNALGRQLRMLQETPPVKGHDLTMSIDLNLQREAEEAFGERVGALVALNPGTGEILGMISKPSFDPNLFTRGISRNEWLAISANRKNPMLNRALQSQYPPGSTFKIVTALAGLEEGAIDPDLRVNCRGGIRLGNRTFGCWRKEGHGVVSLHRALVESCDVYFYETGKRLGIDKIHHYATGLGLGQKTGIELGRERQGLIPSTAWKKENKKLPWFPGETLNAAIGQGYVATTPIQLAVMMGAVAHGGIRYKPSLIKDAAPVVAERLQVNPENLDIIRNGLSGVVNERSGTGWAAKSFITSVSGKTGTAQVIGLRKGAQTYSEMFRDHAWFVAFAPYENPEIALAVLVEHGGHGGASAAPIAKKAIDAYLKPKQAPDLQQP